MLGKIIEIHVKVCLCEFMKYHKWNTMTYFQMGVFTVLKIYQIQKVTKATLFLIKQDQDNERVSKILIILKYNSHE